MLLSELRSLIDQTIARTGDGMVRATYEGVAVPFADLYRADPKCDDLPPPPSDPYYLLEIDDNGGLNYRARFEHPADRAP